ncbi:gypsy retrotransposon integrase-like protein 1 [Engraulis encrasicolus]|uniref:gypsy retrotransposon integrase-like protein 1 n=1 Tax=Engraulis encrasicolus TaxID=184585 RepID=UPI002FD1260A
MLSVDSIQVAEEEVVESSSNRLEDIYTFVAQGCYPQSMNPIRKKNLKRYAQKFIIDDGRLYYVGPKKDEKREVVIEAERKRQIFLDCHFNDIGHHLGQKKTVHRIQSKYYWLGIVKDVVDWIKDCETCQHTERNKNMTRIIRPIKVDGPWEVIAVEILGPYPETVPTGNTHVVVITDYFSKWVEGFPVQRKDSISVARCISTSVYRFGSLKTVYVCQTEDFCEEVSKHLSERWSIVQKVSSPDQPQMNALCGQNSGLLRTAIKDVVADKQLAWDDFIDPVLSLFRTSTNPTTKFTPYCLMFNRKASMPKDVKLDLLAQDGEEAYPFTEEGIMSFMTAMQEQHNAIRQLVLGNMNAAYKQEKKNAKRKMRSITYDVTEPLFGNQEPAPCKRLKDMFLLLPVETVLTTGQNAGDDKKSDLKYSLPDAEVQ